MDRNSTENVGGAIRGGDGNEPLDRNIQQVINNNLFKPIVDKLKDLELLTTADLDKLILNVNILQQTNRDLHNEILILRQTQSKLINKVEYFRDLEKSNNILIFGIQDELSSEELTSRLIRYYGQKLTNNFIISMKRLGKNKDHSKNPLLITVSSSYVSKLILKNCRCLKGTGIFIRRDISVNQRTINKGLAKKCRELRERNIRASYCNGGLRIKNKIYKGDELESLDIINMSDTATQKYATSKRNKTFQQQKYILYTYNCRSLMDDCRLLELMEELKNVEWDVVGLSEVRRKGEECIDVRNGMKFYYNGEASVGGTGFLINENSAKQIISFKGYSHRVSRLLWKPGSKKYGRVKIIQVYAPTSDAEEERIEEFYAALQNALDEDTSRYTIIMGDWNAKIGKNNKEETTVGEFGLGERNYSGERMIEFMEANRMFVMNTFFKKDLEKKWTWISPDGKTKNEIDYITSNNKRFIEDVEIEDQVNTGSDHRAIKAVLKIEKRKMYTKSAEKLDISKEALESSDYTEKLTERLNREIIKDLEINKMEDRIVKAITETTKEVIKKVPNKERRVLPEEIRKLMRRRRRLKRQGRGKIEFAEVSKTIRKRMISWAYKRDIEELEEAVKEGSSLKKLNKSQKLGRKNITAMKNVYGVIMREEEEILNIITGFYKKLYSPPTEENNSIYYCNERSQGVLKEILIDEVEAAVRKTRCGKTGGSDNIINEQVKLGGEKLVVDLCQLFNYCLETQTIPLRWLQSKLLLLHKKGDKCDIKNYRPINLLSVIYKVFMSIITRRIENQLEFDSPVDQVGFKKNFSTSDAILVIQQLISKAQEYQFSIFFLFIDFEKAFDSVYHEAILEAMRNNMVEERYINLFKYIYKNSTLKISVGNKFKIINLKRGLRQGDVPSAKIFGSVLEEVFKRCCWSQYGINVNGEYLNVLKFADDIVLIGKSQNEIRIMMNDLRREAEAVGLKMNPTKSKMMRINNTEELVVELEGKQIEEVKEFIYLGQLIHTEEGISKEISRRIRIGWSAFNKYRKLFRSGVDMQSKRKLWNCVVRPTLIYACETWPLTQVNLTKLRRTERAMERSMLKVRRREKKSNRWIRERTGMEDIAKSVGKKKWKWTGHIMRSQDQRWTKKILEWRPWQLKRKRGRPKLKWDQEMRKICGGATWKRVTLDRPEWARLSDVFVEVWLSEVQ